MRQLKLKVESQTVNGETTVEHGHRTPYHQRHRLITLKDDSNTYMSPTPPDPSQRPTNTNLFTVLNSEQKPEPTEIPSGNDVNEMSSVGFKDIAKAKKQEKSDIENARYHSIADEFDKTNKYHIKKYKELLNMYNKLNPSEKPDHKFHDKKPSKERYKTLIQKINKLQEN